MMRRAWRIVRAVLSDRQGGPAQEVSQARELRMGQLAAAGPAQRLPLKPAPPPRLAPPQAERKPLQLSPPQHPAPPQAEHQPLKPALPPCLAPPQAEHQPRRPARPRHPAARCPEAAAGSGPPVVVDQVEGSPARRPSLPPCQVLAVEAAVPPRCRQGFRAAVRPRHSPRGCLAGPAARLPHCTAGWRAPGSPSPLLRKFRRPRRRRRWQAAYSATWVTWPAQAKKWPQRPRPRARRPLQRHHP